MKLLVYLLALIMISGVFAPVSQAMPVDDSQSMMMAHDCCDKDDAADEQTGCCDNSGCQCAISCAAVLHSGFAVFPSIPSLGYEPSGYLPLNSTPSGPFRPPRH